MEGCRPLTDDELSSIRLYFQEKEKDLEDPWFVRNKTLFYFSLHIGTRISETLSFRLNDVYQNGKIIETIYLRKRNTKGKVSGRNIPLNEEIRNQLKYYIGYYNLSDRLNSLGSDPPLWISKKGSLKRCQATNIIKTIFDDCELSGKLSCHTTRKTFARKIYDKTGKNLLNLQIALGHKNISSTQHYVKGDLDLISQAISSLEY